MVPKRRDLAIQYLPVDALVPYGGNARTHSKAQIKGLAASIKEFGSNNPILIDENNMILAGHGRLEAAKSLGMKTFPTLRIVGLSEDQKRAYVLADNKLATKAGWDKELLQIEINHLIEVNFSMETIGFDIPEVDLMLKAEEEKKGDPENGDAVPDLHRDKPAVTKPGDIWLLGSKKKNGHQLLAGDARDAAGVAAFMGTKTAAMAIIDPPYNVRIKGHVSGKGKHKHAEFAMASGDMKAADFTEFLTDSLKALLAGTDRDAMIYMFMDWRHLFEGLAATRTLGLTLINLCVWNKTNGGMGSLYRSKHEMVLVLRRPDAQHRNNVELGKHGRSRTNVWDYAGVNTFREGRDEELGMHPTVKPVAMIADAIRDVTKPGDIVLDTFAGSGTIFIAAEKTGRRARGIEIDPYYCDVAVRRWQSFTGKQAILAETGETFETVELRRRSENAPAPRRASAKRKVRDVPAKAPVRRAGRQK